MKQRLLSCAGAALMISGALAARPAAAQFQSCNFCDVFPFTPDPFPVNACDTGTMILNGAGYRSLAANGCLTTPDVAVRSTRTDRIVITGFTVLSDTRISFDYQVPCTATSGIAGIDVTIDDDPTDGIVPYACGNARMQVNAIQLSVSYASASATAAPGGVELRWQTLAEDSMLGFLIQTRGGDGIEAQLPVLIEAGAPSRSYLYRDTRPEALAGQVAAYRVVELRDDGLPGDGTDWLAVARPRSPAAGRLRSARGRTR